MGFQKFSGYAYSPFSSFHPCLGGQEIETNENFQRDFLFNSDCISSER